MKALANLSFFLALGVLSAACSSSSNITKSQEYDDMYFSSNDRAPVYLVTAEYNEESSFNDEYIEPLSEEKVESYQDVNYSSKTINPEYIEKYSSEAFAQEEDQEEVEYFDETYTQYDNQDGYKRYIPDAEGPINPNQYSTQGFGPAINFGTSWMAGNRFYNPYVPYANPFAYDTFGRPMSGNPANYGYNRSMSFHLYNSYAWNFGYPYTNPYGYAPFYDPFYYNDPTLTGINVGLMGGFGFGGFGGGYYCPPGSGVTVNGYGGNPGSFTATTASVNENAARPQTYGARSSRSNNATASSQRSQYRSGNTGVRDNVDRVELPNGRTGTSEQGNYYRRSRSSNSGTYASSNTTDRNYQRYRRSSSSPSSNVTTRSSRTSSPTSYRTSSSSTGRSSTGNRYRTYERRGSSSSGFGSRSSSSYRSSGSRSSSSFSSGSRSTPSRSSSYRSSGGSRSSGASRSSGGSRSSGARRGN